MLSVNNLNAGYGDAQVLWDIAFRVDEGEIVTILGPNGAGKTSLVNTLVGLVSNRSGTAVFYGTNLIDLPAHQVADQGIAVVPEGRRLFPEMSVMDNLDIGSFTPAARSYHADTLATVYELFPILKERRNQLAGTLSGGQQQMVAIGRALMARPKLLLLDEPSLGLAPVIVDRIFETLQTINAAGTSVLIVEQNIVKALELSSRGYILEQGRIVQEGSAEALANDEGVRQAYLGL